jgi:hypothetical protein
MYLRVPVSDILPRLPPLDVERVGRILRVDLWLKTIPGNGKHTLSHPT